MNLNFSPSPSPSPFPFPMEQMKEKVVEHDDEQQYHQALNFGLNHHQINVPSSSSSASCHIFFNPAQDHAGFYHPQLYQPHHHHPEDDYYAYHDGGSSSSYEMEKKVENGLKLSLQWKKEDQVVKWMKKEDGGAKIEVKKVVKLGWSGSCCEELSGDDMSSNSNSSSYNYCNITPIRVCSDCHTTKTPLWRSGPKGPKSLCNACGIRQRKARRAVAAAAAAANGGGGVTCNPPRATKEKVKVKEKMGKIGLKKRCKVGGGGGGGGSSTSTSTSSGKKKKKKINGFEDFLINLSNKLAIHRVFPQDEKEAAILLMALSSGLFHG